MPKKRVTQDTRGSLCETKSKNFIFLDIKYCFLLYLDIEKNRHQLKFSHKDQILWYQLSCKRTNMKKKNLF